MSAILEAIRLTTDLQKETPETLAAKYKVGELRGLVTTLGLPAPVNAKDRRKANIIQALLTESTRIANEIQRFNAETITVELPTEMYDVRLKGLQERLLKVTPENMDALVSSIAGEWMAYENARYADTTKLKNVTKVSNALKSYVGGQNETYQAAAKKLVGILRGANSAVSAELRNTYKAAVKKKATDEQRFPVSSIMGKAVDLVATAAGDNSLDNVNRLDLTLAVMLLTGRRPAEVLSFQSDFLADSDNRLVFTGRAKSKGASVEDQETPIVFNVPGGAMNVQQAVKVLASAGCRDLEHGDVNKTYGKPLSRQVSKWSKELETEALKPYDMRKMFASYQIARYHDEAKHGDSSYWVAGLLGHAKDDGNTVNSYKSFKGIWSDEALAL